MKSFCYALAVAASMLAAPAAAITFPSLTTIYVGSGVTDRNGMINVATVFHCSNVSGQSASIRYLVLNTTGGIVGNFTTSVAHGAHHTAATRDTAIFSEQVIAMGPITQEPSTSSRRSRASSAARWSSTRARWGRTA